jgi:transposase-like protein
MARCQPPFRPSCRRTEAIVSLPEIISHAVWLYYRFSLSLRDVEELLAERGVTVTYETIRAWCGKFGPAYAGSACTPE